MPNATLDPQDERERLSQAEENPRTPAELLERIPTMSPDDPRGVYDRPGNLPDKHAQRPKPGGASAGPKELSDAEGSPGKSFYNNGAGAAGDAVDPDSFYRPGGGDLRSGILMINKRRGLMGGGVVASIAGLVYLFTLLAGPSQFIQLSHVLQRNLAGNDHTANLRITRLFRFAKTGRVGETRVNAIGSHYFGKFNDQLRDVGIEFQTTSFDTMKSITFDTGKLQKNFPELKDMSEAEQRSWLANKFNLDEGQFVKVSGLNGGTKYAVNTRRIGVGATRALINSLPEALDSGAIETAMMTRAAKGFFNLPSLFSPLKRLSAGAENKAAAAADKAAYEKASEERLKNLTQSGATPEAVTAKEKIKSSLKDNEGKVTTVLVAQAGLCLVRSIADDAVTFNRGYIVAPAALQSADKVAIGEGIEAGGKDVSATQIGVESDNLFANTKDGTIWQAQALKATEGLPNITGPDLPTEYEQAFSGHTTADSIKKYVTLKIAGHDVSGIACSKAGLVVGGVAGIAVLFATPFTGGGSVAAYAALKAGEAAATGGIIYLLQKEVTPLVEDKAVVPDVLNGPLGGNLLAYGFREMSNIEARSAGGVAMEGTETSTLSPTAQAFLDEQYNSKSTLAKLFDYNDYRSLTGRIIENTSPSFTDNIAKMGTAMLHFGNIFSSINRLLSPNALADAQPYNWGFARYGIPDSIADNPKYDDPYANADAVAKLLDSSSGKKYIDRAKSCFGVNISKDASSNWQAVPYEGKEGDVNPSSSDYTDANCNDSGDNWQRLMLFVFDSRTMDSAACYLGDDSSCDNVDPASTSAAPSDSSVSSGTPSNDTGSYLNPLRDVKGLQINRIDQGVDYGGTGPVYAIGNGKVNTVSSSAGWPGGTFINYSLSDGPAAGKNIFVAEDCLPQVKQGQSVTSSTVLCIMTGGPDGIETGWAADPGAGTIAAAHDVYKGHPDGDATAYGKNFSDFMKSFGGPPGDITKSTSTKLLSSLPAGWPSWQ